MTRTSEENILLRIQAKCKEKDCCFIKFLTEDENLYKRRCLIKCNKCENLSDFSVSNIIYRDFKCLKCKPKTLSKNIVNERILHACDKRNLEFLCFDGGKYSGSSTKVVVKCKSCGEILKNIQYKNLVDVKRDVHVCFNNKNKVSLKRLESHAKNAKDEIIQKLINTDFEFLNFENNIFIGVEKTKVFLKCKKCGSISTILYVNIMKPLFSGRCRKCNKHDTKNKNITQNDIDKRCDELGLAFISIDKNNDKINNKSKIITKCMSCGKQLRPVGIGYFFTHGKKCEHCYKDGMYTQKQAEDRVLLICKNNNWDFCGYIDGCYTNTSCKIKIRCNNCGEIFIIEMREMWHRKNYGHSCKTGLRIEKRIETRKRYKQLIIDKLFGTDLEFISFFDEPQDAKKPKAIIKCKRCGKFMTYMCQNILKDSFPMKCKYCGLYSLDEENAINYINKICDKRGFTFKGFNTEDGHYKGILTRLFLQCGSCSHVWSNNTFTSLRRGVLCPNCEKQKWKMEEEIRSILKNENINYIYNCRKSNLSWLKNKKSLSLDFYLPEYKIAIECQGEQHFKSIPYFGGYYAFEKSLERDKIKLKLCKDHNIKILYYDSQNGNKTFLGESVYNTQKEIIEEIHKIKNT